MSKQATSKLTTYSTNNSRPVGQQGGDNNSKKADNMKTSQDIHSFLKHTISLDLSPSIMNANRVHFETLLRCSYYLDVIRLDLPLSEQNYLTDSTFLHLIDPWKLQRMKKLANSQVKIQLSLLEELHKQLMLGRQKLNTLLESCDPSQLMLEAESIQEMITEVLKNKMDFDLMQLPGRLHSKHQLIADMGSASVPQLRLSLMLKMPVHFNRQRSFTVGTSASLCWQVAGSNESVDIHDQFELCYKLIQPTCALESADMGVINCWEYSTHVEGLRPDRCYEFSIKRVDSCCLVYGLWNDTILLGTISTTNGE